MNYINAKFKSIRFECLLKINEKIIPYFVLEFYSQLEFNYDSEGHFVVHFVIQNKSFSFTLEEFGHILKILFKGHCSYSDKWSLDQIMARKRCRSSNPSSSSNVLDRPSSSHHIDENNDGNDEESFRSNTPSPSQLINSLSNVVPRVFENPPHENQTIHSYQYEILNHQRQYRNEHRKGLRSTGRALKNAMKGSKK
ncbi:hypothetical protein Tco_1072224 [Tanacetum coccineum]